VTSYVKASRNEQISASKAAGVKEEWLWDQLIKTDTAIYVVMNIGHSNKDDGDAHFSNDQWLYIDTATRRMYEYDLPNDSLIRWR
jgi:hypothetical protein